jgi:hypothetical protein
MVFSSHFDAAEFLHNVCDPTIVRRNQHLSQCLCLFAPFDDVLNQRFSGNECEWFAWKPGGRIAGRDNAENVHLGSLSVEGLSQNDKCTFHSLRIQPDA